MNIIEPKMTEEQKAFFSGEASREFPSDPMPLSTEATKRLREVLLQAAENARNGIYKSELIRISAPAETLSDEDIAFILNALGRP